MFDVARAVMSCRRVMLLLGLLIVAGLWSSTNLWAADQRLEAPAAEQLEHYQARIAEQYKDGYAKARTKTSDRVALAADFLQQATANKDDPNLRFVLLIEARDLATSSGDIVTAMKAADELATGYRIAGGKVRAVPVAGLLQATISSTAAEAGTEAFLDSAELVLRLPEGEWQLAIELFKAAEQTSRKTRNLALATTAKNRLREVETLISESDKAVAHRSTLKSNPNDPAANLALGRYLCIYRQDWEAGITHLAKGADEKIKAVATRDVVSAQAAPSDMLTLADDWYALAESENGDAKEAFKSRAEHWYSRAVPGLAGIDKTRAEKRLDDLQASPVVAGSKARMWANIRRAVKAGALNRWKAVGGSFARDTFEELPTEGALLIGFRYSIERRGFLNLGLIQPIYLTARGETMGKTWGTPAPGEEVSIIKAKPGYAVGAIHVRGGGLFDACQFIFMRITDKGLNVRDRYEGPMVGGTGGNPGMLGGDGNFIVGIHGRVDSNSKEIEAMSPITLTTETPVPASDRPQLPPR